MDEGRGKITNSVTVHCAFCKREKGREGGREGGRERGRERRERRRERKREREREGRGGDREVYIFRDREGESGEK